MIFKNQNVIEYIYKRCKYITPSWLIHNNEEITQELFLKYVSFFDVLAEHLNENNNDVDSKYKIYMIITSLKEPRTPLSAHDINNDKFAVDLQINFIGGLKKKNTIESKKQHLIISMFWLKWFKRILAGNKNCQVFRIGQGDMTYHFHISEEFKYPIRLFETNVLNDVSESFNIDTEKVKYVINHTEFIDTKNLLNGLPEDMRVYLPVYFSERLKIIESDNEQTGEIEEQINIISDTIFDTITNTATDVVKPVKNVGKTVSDNYIFLIIVSAIVYITLILKKG